MKDVTPERFLGRPLIYFGLQLINGTAVVINATLSGRIYFIFGNI